MKNQAGLSADDHRISVNITDSSNGVKSLDFDLFCSDFDVFSRRADLFYPVFDLFHRLTDLLG